MPREVPELRGEPLSWDGRLRLVHPDGSEVRIERAISVSDICPPYAGEGIRQSFLCFFDGQRDGPCVAYLVTIKLEGKRSTHGIHSGWATLTDVIGQTERGQRFLHYFEEACGIKKEDILKLLA